MRRGRVTASRGRATATRGRASAPRPVGPPPTPTPAPVPIGPLLPPADAIATVTVPPAPLALIDFLQGLETTLADFADTDTIPDRAKIDTRLWVQHHPGDNFLRRLETFETVGLWKEALRYILQIDDADAPATPQDRFLRFLRQRQVVVGDENRRTAQSVEEMRDTIATRIVLPQPDRPSLTPERIRSHLRQMSFNDLYLLYDLKDLPLDTTDAVLENAFKAIVRKDDPELEWDNHVLSRLFTETATLGNYAREFVRASCFFPSMLSEVYTFLRARRWTLIRRQLQQESQNGSDRLPANFWELRLPRAYLNSFPKRLWSLDRVADWLTFFQHLDRLPDPDNDASIYHALEKIRKPMRTKLIAENEEHIHAQTATTHDDKPLVAPPTWLKLSNQTIPLESRITLFRTQPWIDAFQVADIVIQALSPHEKVVQIDSPFYTETSFRTSNGEMVWVPRVTFFEALFDPREIAPRMNYHTMDETITIPNTPGVHFRIYFSLPNGQFVRMTREWYTLQQKWFRHASEASITNVKGLSMKNMADRPLVQFGKEWLDRVRQKETVLLTEILSASRGSLFSSRHEWDFARLAEAIEKGCANLDGASIRDLTTLGTYWKRIFLVHSLFRERSILGNLRKIFEARLRHGMIQLERIALAPLRVLVPELWALDPAEAEQVEKIYEKRGDQFVHDRLVESIGVYFPRAITERTPTRSSFVITDYSPIPIRYPSEQLATSVQHTREKSDIFLLWDANGKLFSIDRPDEWSTTIQKIILDFFDEDTFEAGNAETALCISDMMRFTITVRTTNNPTGENTGAEASGRPSFATTTTETTTSWILPDFVHDVLNAISSLDA